MKNNPDPWVNLPLYLAANELVKSNRITAKQAKAFTKKHRVKPVDTSTGIAPIADPRYYYL